MLKLFFVWGDWESITPTCYEPACALGTINEVTESRGYTPSDIAQINALKVGGVWHSDEGNHFIVRIPGEISIGKSEIAKKFVRPIEVKPDPNRNIIQCWYIKDDKGVISVGINDLQAEMALRNHKHVEDRRGPGVLIWKEIYEDDWYNNNISTLTIEKYKLKQ